MRKSGNDELDDRETNGVWRFCRRDDDEMAAGRLECSCSGGLEMAVITMTEARG